MHFVADLYTGIESWSQSVSNKLEIYRHTGLCGLETQMPRVVSCPIELSLAELCRNLYILITSPRYRTSRRLNEYVQC